MSHTKQVIIFYFSGTGNARQIASWFSGMAIEQKIDCRMVNIEKAMTEPFAPINSDSILLFILPVHGFNFPKIMLDFIRRFPKGTNNIVLINTRAGIKAGRFVIPGLSGGSLLIASFLLKRKGYTITGKIPFDMPSNWISIHPALKEEKARFLFERNYRKVQQHAGKIFSGKPDFLASRDLLQDIVFSFISLLYYAAGRFFFAKSYYASNTCTHCGLCEKNCPVGAIRNKYGRPFWTFKCESCMRCMNICPHQAIETAHGLWGVSIAASLATSYSFYKFIATYPLSGLIVFLLFSVIFIVLLWAFYEIEHLLLRNKTMAKLISYTSLTHYKFWGRFKPAPGFYSIPWNDHFKCKDQNVEI